MARTATPRSALTERQERAQAILSGYARHVMLFGGSRSGKTYVLVRRLLVRALYAPGSRHAIWRFRFNHVRASVWLDTLPKVAADWWPQVPLKDDHRDGRVLLPNGSEIWFGGLDEKERTEKVLGQEYSTIYFNECSQIPYSSVTTALTRLAQTAAGKDGPLQQKAYYDCNPPSTGHWTHRLFVERREPISKASLPDPEDYVALAMNPRDNLANLSTEYVKSLEALPERQRRRFLEGRFTDDTEGALWTLDAIERARASEADVPQLDRVVVAVDPSGTSGPEDKRSDEVGIVVAGRGRDGRAYVLADYSLRAAADGWAKVVLAAYDKHQADAIVAERNFGGDMVPAMFRNVRPDVPIRVVTASRGKHIRAEPVAALYERDRVRHIGRFEALEDQLLGFTTAGYVGDKSPDRADALVHGLTDLLLGLQDGGGVGAPAQVAAGERSGREQAPRFDTGVAVLA